MPEIDMQGLVDRLRANRDWTDDLVNALPTDADLHVRWALIDAVTAYDRAIYMPVDLDCSFTRVAGGDVYGRDPDQTYYNLSAEYGAVLMTTAQAEAFARALAAEFPEETP